MWSAQKKLMSSHITETRACQFTNMLLELLKTETTTAHPQLLVDLTEASFRALSCRKQSRLTSTVLKHDVFSLLLSAVLP